MSTVVMHAVVSVDGYIADENDGVDELFGWYGNGDVAVPTADPRWTFHVTPESAGHRVGALLAGRRLFDHSQGRGVTHLTDEVLR